VAQLGELERGYDALRAAGVSVFALSTETIEEMLPLERRLRGRVTFLSDSRGSFVDAMGVRMRVPWFDKLFFRARQTDMAMPLTALIDASGRIVWLYRARTVDDRPSIDTILGQVPGRS
jgi:peroxiredoxin